MKFLFKKFEWILAILASIALMAMMIITFVDVIGRYVFNNSIFGVAEMIEMLMVAVIFAGLAFVTAADNHIKVEILEAGIKRYIPNLQRWMTVIFSLIAYAGITWELAQQAARSFESGKQTTVLNAPQWIMPGTAALLSAIGVALLVTATITTRGHPSRLAKADDVPVKTDPTDIAEL